ncbi:MAG TPA: hypothetical protein VGN88_13010 [Phycisphaerae bacterium]|jgi:hypothetical protein
MKQHILRQREEQEAKNAQAKQRGYGRPGPAPQAPAPAAPAASVEKVADLTDLPAVWLAARKYLSQSARLLESVLGNCARIESLNPSSQEVILLVPKNHTGFANEKARPRLEEALRAAAGIPLKLQVKFTDEMLAPPPATGAIGTVPMAAQRIAPEIMDAVKNQPVIKELMKRLDATVTQVEIIETPGTPAAAD